MMVLLTLSCDTGSDDSGDGGSSYFVTFTVDSSPLNLTDGIAEGNGIPVAAYNSTDSELTIYAYAEDVSFVDLQTTTTTGIIIKDINLTEAGTDSTASVVYYESGTAYIATNVEVVITSYGAETEAIVGTFASCSASYGSTTKELGAGSFTVFNSGEE